MGSRNRRSTKLTNQLMISIGVRRCRDLKTLDVTFLPPQSINGEDLGGIGLDLPSENGFISILKERLTGINLFFSPLSSVSAEFKDGLKQLTHSPQNDANSYHD